MIMFVEYVIISTNGMDFMTYIRLMGYFEKHVEEGDNPPTNTPHFQPYLSFTI